MKLVTAGGEDISLSPTSKLRESQNLNELLNKRIEEVRTVSVTMILYD